MKKLIFILSILLLVGCTPPTAEREMPEIDIQDQSVIVNDEGIVITFPDDFERRSYNEKDYVYFGPLGFVPEAPDNRQDFIYQLNFIGKRDFEKISEEVKQQGRSVTMEPAEIQINNFSAVKWAVGGMCEARIIEILGKKYNTQFYSSGCHNDLDTDFSYFEGIIRNIEIK